MATSTYTGALYGTGVYGAASYGIVNVSILVDGVQGTCTTDSGVIITADANHVVIGVTSPAAVGQVGVIGKAVVAVTGNEATTAVGTTDQVATAVVVPTGVAATGQVGSVTIVAKAVVVTVSVEGLISAGNAVPVADANTAVTLGQLTGSVNGAVNIFENELHIITSVQAVATAGTLSFVINSFDYEAVADQYSTARTVYVGSRSTSKSRTVLVPAEDRKVVAIKNAASRTIYVPASNRVVYIIGNRSTAYTRTKLAA